MDINASRPFWYDGNGTIRNADGMAVLRTVGVEDAAEGHAFSLALVSAVNDNADLVASLRGTVDIIDGIRDFNPGLSLSPQSVRILGEARALISRILAKRGQ